MKIYLQTLGCDKNRVDAEIALAHIVKAGHTITYEPAEAECIIVNTCCFIEDATQESIDEILQLAQYKEEGALKRLVVMGCMVNRYRQELMEGIPEIDHVLGTSDVNALSSLFPPTEDVVIPADRVLTTPKHYAYLRIADGCDNKCTYCVIPSIRGKYKSVPLDVVVSEAKELVAAGAKELILVAQDTTMYGTDLDDTNLVTLLDALHELDVEWIRILYAYPERITDEIIEAMARLPKVCKYIDMPIQHADDTVLRRMGRHTNQEEIETVIGKLREAMPSVTLRTTLISGFPGEMAKQHQHVLDFVEKMQFDRLGVFPYSKEEETPAARMDNQIDDEVKKERAAEIMELQQEIHFAKSEKKVGQVVDVLIDGYDEEEDWFYGRMESDAPDVDTYVYLNEEVEIGDFVKVRLTEVYGYDFFGELTEKQK